MIPKRVAIARPAETGGSIGSSQGALSSWSALLFPERFAADELREGVRSFLIHAPNHVAAAAKLDGRPIEDVFGVDATARDTH